MEEKMLEKVEISSKKTFENWNKNEVRIKYIFSSIISEDEVL